MVLTQRRQGISIVRFASLAPLREETYLPKTSCLIAQCSDAVFEKTKTYFTENKMTLIKNILVPTDFSRNSGSAINYACDMAKDSSSTLHLLHILNGSAKNEVDVEIKSLERLNSVLDAHSELAIETIKKVASGRPAIVISDYARENKIDLIVMGTHGRTGLVHLAMGSVTEDVLRESPCPIVVLGPHDGENVSLEHGVEALTEIVGEGLEADPEDGRGLMLKKLVETLRIPSTTAILLLDELIERDWIQWGNGRWSIVEGTEFVENFKPIEFNITSDSQAVDLLVRARKLRATDIHIDPSGDEENVVRLRIDGELRQYCKLQRSVADHLVNQFKTLSRLDISDPFHAQEGRVRLPSALKNLDVRFTSVPVAEGQAVALRMFDSDKIFMPIEQLGFNHDGLRRTESMLREGEGLILVTGPTGAGKTTTVYSMLETIGGEKQNIVSIEDPVEFVAPFVRQINVDPRHGLTMANGMRTMLRMDPDVLFIGEIRDPDAAAIGMRAAASGKYVFSTMHTRDVASTITALRDFGLEDRSIAANLTGVINQRLVRRLCGNCKQATQIVAKHADTYRSTPIEVPDLLFEPVGCSACLGTGYRGRIGIFEVAHMSSDTRELITNGCSDQELEKHLRSAAVDTLQCDALRKAASGDISFEDAIGIRWIE